MRTIRELLGNDEKVWVYLNSEDTWKQFVNMAVAEGFHFGDLPVERWAFGYVMLFTVTVIWGICYCLYGAGC